MDIRWRSYGALDTPARSGRAGTVAEPQTRLAVLVVTSRRPRHAP